MSIKVNQISKHYGDQKALDQVEFSIPKGQIVGFLGPNGAGKSTLMKILTGYMQAESGSAKIVSHDIIEAKQTVQKKIGYLPEHNPLYLEMYVREYLDFHRQIHQVDANQVEELIKKTGLLPEANKKIEQLSKGYRQRVGLAAALLHNPEVLILDEPTTGLDPKQLVEIRQLIRQEGKDKTILLSTHIMQEVEAICDRVIIINKGKIVADKMLNDWSKSESQIVEVEFNYRIEEVAFNELPQLEKSINTSGFKYDLYFNTQKDMRSEVFDFAYDKGLKIISLNNKNQTLESLFIELTAD